MPISAVVARGDITERADAYVASTYSGHPAACMAAIKTIEILYRDRLFDYATELGAYARERLLPLKDKTTIVGEVRGKGLWLAVEFVTDSETRGKNYAAAAAVNKRCLERGLYYIHDSISWFVRIQPPLNIERALFEQGLDILETAILEVGGRS
jgi:4-aminobutyrate aminotransferase-like enzyme